MKVAQPVIRRMPSMLIGYARCSTDEQDLTAQRNALLSPGVTPQRVSIDHGLTGTNRVRPGLREALAACHSGDTLVVTKLDRLAQSVTDTRDIVEELTATVDPIGRLLFNVMAMIAEFESDPIRMRTRESMKDTLAFCAPSATPFSSFSCPGFGLPGVTS